PRSHPELPSFPRRRSSDLGTTPPYSLCRSIWDEMMLDSTSLPLCTTAAAVSSHELSIARIFRSLISFMSRLSIFKHQFRRHSVFSRFCFREYFPHIIHIRLRSCQGRTVVRQPHFFYLGRTGKVCRFIKRHMLILRSLCSFIFLAIHALADKQIRLL